MRTHKINRIVFPCSKHMLYWYISSLEGQSFFNSEVGQQVCFQSSIIDSWNLQFPSLPHIPIGSMYGTCTYIYHKSQPNVGKHTWILLDGVTLSQLHPRKTNMETSFSFCNVGSFIMDSQHKTCYMVESCFMWEVSLSYISCILR